MYGGVYMFKIKLLICQVHVCSLLSATFMGCLQILVTLGLNRSVVPWILQLIDMKQYCQIGG